MNSTQLNSNGDPVFYGIGVGPGDPELLTLKGERILKSVDVVCYPACKRGASSYALRIVKALLDPSRQIIEGLVFPMSKDFASLVSTWRESAQVIVEHLRLGRSVAFITEGDPMLYSTFLHVYEIIAAEYPATKVEIIPGVSSISAVAAAGQIPLGQGDEAIAIVPATYRAAELRDLVDRFDTVVMMKAGGVLDELIPMLDEAGLRDNALLVSRVGTRQEIVTRDLDAWRGKRLHYLTTLLVTRRNTSLIESLIASGSDATEAEPDSEQASDQEQPRAERSLE